MAETESGNQSNRPSKGWALLVLSTLLFVGGIGIGVWATQTFLLNQPIPEKQFGPNAQMASSVSDRQAQEPAPVLDDRTILDPKKYIGKSGYSRLTDAVLINGGGQPDSNYFSHHLHIRMLHELLTRRGLSKKHIQVLSTDGENRSPDQVISNPLPKSWLWQGLQESSIIDTTRLINTTFRQGRMLPAQKRYIRRGFQRMAQRFKRKRKPSTLLLFVTDHGTKGKGPWGNKIELWKEQLSVGELRKVLAPLGSKTRVISVMSQCYSGGFANLLYRKNWKVHGNRCGFFSTVANREAYGCFPETATKDRIGHAYRIIRAMRTSRTIRDAHRKIVVSDLTPDVPVSTSDIFLEDMLRRKFRRVRPWTNGVDRILTRVWRKPHRELRSDIRLLRKIEKVFYLPRYRTMARVWKDIHRIRYNLKQIKPIESEWKSIWKRVQDSAIVGFYNNNPRLYQRLQSELERNGIDERSRRLGRQLHTSLLSHLTQNKPVDARLSRMHKRYSKVQKKVHLLHTHEAALLRVAKRLTRIAGLEYLRRSGSRRYRRDFRRLMVCESTPIGGRNIRGVLRAEGMKRDSNKRRKLPKIAMKSLIPSQLGIGYDGAPKGWYPRFEKIAPGAVIVTQVYPNTSASKSGIRVGDIIVAVGGKMLKLFGEIGDLVLLSPPSKKTFFLVYRNRKLKTLRIHLLPKERELVAMAPPQAPGDKPGDNSPGFQDDQDHDTRVYGLRRHRQRPIQRKPTPRVVSLKSVSGQPITFPAKKGATIAFYWATWCEGCKAMAPMLRRLQAKYQRSGLTLLTVTSDSPSMLRPFLRQWGTRWPFRVAIDKSRTLTRQYRISTIPQLMIFRPNGSVALHVQQFNKNSQQQIESALQQLLK